MPPPPASHPERPRLRPLEVRPARNGGRAGILLRDPLGLAPGDAFVPEGLVPVLAMFDGEGTVAGIQARLLAAGVALPPGFVAGLVQQLDDALLLESSRSAAALAAAAESFLGPGVRPARLPGSAGYPAEIGALRRRLESIAPPSDGAGAGFARGLVAPHIDLARGEHGYAAAYRWLAAREPAELYVVFGTGHGGPGAPVTGLALDWDTPLGVVRTDRAVIEAVHAALGPPDPCDLLLHRDEHSIEFQMLLLRHALGDRPFRVAGFLCGQLPSADGDPGREEYVAAIAAAVRTAAGGARVCFVAGADLAHVGPFFGDAEPVDDVRLAKIRADDRARLQHVLAGAPGRFHQAVARDGNPDRICGTTPIFLAALLAGGRAELLHYGQARADDGSQVVTFASVGFT